MKSHFIDATDASDVALVTHLQKMILPGDRVADVGLGWWWVLEVDRQPAGFCGMQPSQQWQDAGYLCRAGVRPEFRGRGLQRRMIHLRERAARRLGLTWLVTDTTENPASANNLIACGFRIYAPSVPWGWKHTIYWRKRVGASR